VSPVVVNWVLQDALYLASGTMSSIVAKENCKVILTKSIPLDKID